VALAMLCLPLVSCGGSSAGHQLSGTVVANLDLDYTFDLQSNGFHGTCNELPFQCFAHLVGKPCPKGAKFEPGVGPGAAVTVYDAQRHVVAATHLQVGDYADFAPVSCKLTFTTKVAGKSGSYSIAVDGLPNESQYSRSDLDRAGWRVALKS
jgi:hypothetical protein